MHHKTMALVKKNTDTSCLHHTPMLIFLCLLLFNDNLQMIDFMDNQVQNVCEGIDDYQISQDRDLPQDLWDKFKTQGFMGLIIPK